MDTQRNTHSEMCKHTQKQRHTDTYIHTEKHTEKCIDTDTQRQTNRDTHRDTLKHTPLHRERHMDMDMDMHTSKQTHTRILGVWLSLVDSFRALPSALHLLPFLGFLSHHIYIFAQSFQWESEKKRRLTLYSQSPTFNRKTLQSSICWGLEAPLGSLRYKDVLTPKQ